MRPAGWMACSGMALLAVVGCASIIGAETRGLEWCLQSANATHAFCDDFDHADAGATWSARTASPGATVVQVSSEDTPPSAMSFAVAQSTGGAIAGLEKDFDQSFRDVRFEADVRFPSVDMQAPMDAQFGILILEANSNSAPGVCIAMSASTTGIYMILLPSSAACVNAANANFDGGFGFGGGMDAATDAAADGGNVFFVPHQVAGFFVYDEWLHLKLEVVRNGDGSGTITFKMAGPGSYVIPMLPAGSIPMDATVSVGIAAVAPAPQPFEVRFDNVTVDFPGQ